MPWIEVTTKRALNERQAARCEDATTANCRCRCGGQFHGAKRGRVVELPKGDPHRPAPSAAHAEGA